MLQKCKMHPLQYCSSCKSTSKEGCRYSSMESSVPTILPHWVRVPNTPSTLLSFIVKFVLCLAWENYENKSKRGRVWPIKNIALLALELGRGREILDRVHFHLSVFEVLAEWLSTAGDISTWNCRFRLIYGPCHNGSHLLRSSGLHPGAKCGLENGPVPARPLFRFPNFNLVWQDD